LQNEENMWTKESNRIWILRRSRKRFRMKRKTRTKGR
jgi:hypothetical protein